MNETDAENCGFHAEEDQLRLADDDVAVFVSVSGRAVMPGTIHPARRIRASTVQSIFS